MVCASLPKSQSVVTLAEMAEWRAKCGFQSRVHELGPRDMKRMRQDENTTDAPCLIDEGLYLGSKDTEADKETLRKLGVTHILQVGEELRPANPGDFVYKSLNVYDLPQEDLVIEFPECFKFIGDAIKNGGGVLVHCAAGVSRSASVVMGYIMYKQDMTFREAREVVRDARPVVSPNMGFIMQLRHFEVLGCDASKWEGWDARTLAQTQFRQRPVRVMSAPVLAAA